MEYPLHSPSVGHRHTVQTPCTGLHLFITGLLPSTSKIGRHRNLLIRLPCCNAMYRLRQHCMQCWKAGLSKSWDMKTDTACRRSGRALSHAALEQGIDPADEPHQRHHGDFAVAPSRLQKLMQPLLPGIDETAVYSLVSELRTALKQSVLHSQHCSSQVPLHSHWEQEQSQLLVWYFQAYVPLASAFQDFKCVMQFMSETGS